MRTIPSVFEKVKVAIDEVKLPNSSQFFNCRTVE